MPARDLGQDRQEVAVEGELTTGRDRVPAFGLGGLPDEVSGGVAVGQGPRVLRLSDDDVLAELGGQLVDVVAQRGHRAVEERVVRQPDDVEGHPTGDEVVEEPVAVDVVAALVEVQHHPQLVVRRVGRSGALDAGLEQRRQVVPAGVRGPVELTRRPQHPVADLVADRHHADRRALPCECRDDVVGVAAHGVGQCGQILALPRGRGVLVLRVGPEVGVVDVQVHLHPGGHDLSRQREVVREVAVAGGRVDPQAHPYVVRAVVPHDLNGTGGPAPVEEDRAGGQFLPGERQVGA